MRFRHANTAEPPLPQDEGGWQVAPAPDGRGMPAGQKPKPPHRWRGFWILAIVLLAINWASVVVMRPSGPERVTIPFSPYFIKQVEAAKVKSITSRGDTIHGTFATAIRCPPCDANASPTTLFSTQVPWFWSNESLTTLLQSQAVEINARNPIQSTSVLAEVRLGFGPTLLLVGLFWVLARRSSGGGLAGVGTFGRSQARKVDPAAIRVSVDDVAGIDEAKSELAETVEFLKTPDRYVRLGGRLPHGVLLFGPPGTGKTLLARAVAGEAHAAFFSIAASEFIEAIVGVGAARVRDLFAKAKEAAPSIIFIDAIGRSRQGSAGITGANDEREQTLDQILTEMDGFEPTHSLRVGTTDGHVGSRGREGVVNLQFPRPCW